MVEQFLPFLNMLIPDIAHFGLVFIRIGAIVMLLPAFGERSIPMRVRLAIGVCFTLAVAPALQLPDPSNHSMMGLIMAEVTTGALFGLMLRMFVLGLQVAGTIAAQSTSLSQMLGASAAIDPQPAISALLVLGGLTLATILDLHIKLFSYMLLTYELVPPFKLVSAENVHMLGLDQVRRCFYLAFSLSAPFLLAAMVYNLTLGFINKAMPQLMVSFVGAPAVTFCGLLLLMLSAPMMLSIWSETMDSFMLNPGARP